ncbi:MAG: hypothetical protein NTV63_00700 [Candidatus Woesearchaeota archaeon]|nr:hypothetical protein [Candidatus Woesearchaeota archaeon]
MSEENKDKSAAAKSASQLEEQISEMKSRLATMEWDMGHNQLNLGKKAYYESLKKECSELEAELKKINSEKEA